MTWTPGSGVPLPPQPGWVPSLPAVPPPVSGKYGVRSTLFTIVVVLASIAGAAILALLFLASGRPDALVVGFLLAALPVGPLVACYLWLDRYEPEPPRLLLSAFGWGALVATASALVAQVVIQVLSGENEVLAGVVVAPITEEAGKGLFVLLLLWSRRHVIDGLLDGLVYAGLVGVGFAFTENILYLAGAYTGGPDLGPGGLSSATALFVVRGIFSPFAHPAFTSATGLGVGVLVSTRNPALRVVAPIGGYLIAVCLHAAWNGSAFLGDGQYFFATYLFAMVPGFFALAGLALWFRVREGRMLGASLSDLAARGYLQPREVPWLVRPSARRTARRQAVLGGGPPAEQLMRDYQQQAIALAALHNRVLRGTAPADSTARGALMVQRLTALRAHVLRPAIGGGRA